MIIKFTGILIVILLLNFKFAHAESAEVYNKLQNLERDFKILQQQYYREGGPKAASGLNVEAADLESRLLAVEEQMRNLNGKIEEIEFIANQAQEKLDLVQQNVDQRLQQINNSEVATSAPKSPSTEAPLNNVDKELKAKSNNTGSLEDSKSAKKLNEDLAQEKPLNKQLVDKAPVSTNPQIANKVTNVSETAMQDDEDQKQEMYNQALALIKKAKLDEAGVILNAFIKRYNNDPLVGYAYYWFGEVFYSQKQFERAAIQYLKGFKNFPKGKKAPDTLLKASMSLARLKKIKESCEYLRKLYVVFPDMQPSLKSKADQEYNRIGCNNQ